MNLVKDSKLNAKWQDDIKRRKNIEKIIDYYYNRQDYYLQRELEKNYPNSYEDMWKYRDFLNLVEQLYDDASIVFENPVSIEFVGSEAVQDLGNEMISKAMFNPVMQKNNIYVNMTAKVGIMPHYDKDEDKVYLEIITGDKIFVKQNEEMPTKADEVWMQTGLMLNSPHVSEKAVEYTIWTKDEQRIVEMNPQTGRIHKLISTNPNPYGRIPIVWFTNDIEEDSFWFDIDNYIVKKNEIINQDLTAARFGMSLQSFSTLILQGFDKKSDIKMGVQRPLCIESALPGETQATAYYITPDSDLEKIYKIINGKAVEAAQSMGISAQSYKKEGSTFNSGYQLKLSKSDIIKKNMADRAFYEPKIKELVKLMMDVYSYNSSKYSFPEGIEINVNFGEIKIEENPLEQAKIDAAELSQNLTTGWQILMRRDPDLTEEEAKELYANNKRDNQGVTVGAGLAGAIGIE